MAVEMVVVVGVEVRILASVGSLVVVPFQYLRRLRDSMVGRARIQDLYIKSFRVGIFYIFFLTDFVWELRERERERHSRNGGMGNGMWKGNMPPHRIFSQVSKK